MRRFLKQNWFLLGLVVSVAGAMAAPGWVAPVAQRVSPHVVVTAALFIMAWTMPTQRLSEELSRPWAAVWAMTVSYGFLPSLAWFVGGLSPSSDLRVGLLLAASVPCTLASCVLWTRLAGGNEATALLAVLGCTLVGWFITPLWLAAVSVGDVTLDPVAMMVDLALTLVVPVALGQLLRIWPPARHLANQRKTLLSAVAQVFVLGIVVKTATNVGIRLHEGDAKLSVADALTSAGLAMAVHLTALFFGFLSAGWLGIDRSRRIAIAFSGSQKTLPISMYLFEGHFQDQYPLAVIPLLFFHVGQLLFDTVIAGRWARMSFPERFETTEEQRYA